MSNGQRNCILGICCPPRSEEQTKALAEELKKVFLDRGEREAAGPGPYAWWAAEYVLKNYDLAPAGSLDVFKAEVAKLARENP